MKLKYLFYILGGMIFLLLAVVYVLSFENHDSLFYVLEGYIVLLLIYLTFLYGKVLRPLNTISNGMDLLKEQDFASRLAPIGQYESDRIVEVFNKMMVQLKDEKLRTLEQNRFLDLLISASPMGVLIQDFNGTFTMVNNAATRFMGVNSPADLIGKHLAEIGTPLAEEIALIHQDESRTVRLSDSMIYRCSCLSFPDRGFQHPFILIESLTDEVMKAEKKAYEKVIRMISHEVNNTVAGVTSTIASVNKELEDMKDTQELIDVMSVCSNRCMSMSQFISNFADVVKIPDPVLREKDLNESVRACKMLMDALCSQNNISLALDLHPDRQLTVNIDEQLFGQVLMNIVKNAVESICTVRPEAAQITIRTTDNPITIEVADNGAGIDKETEAKLFTPFFSTKPKGQGIGLMVIREILMKHHCTFSLKTYPDHITRFRIFFGKH